jgi:hypothetical protein
LERSELPAQGVLEMPGTSLWEVERRRTGNVAASGRDRQT